MNLREAGCAIALLVSACTSDPPLPADGGTCVQGTSQACACTDGRSGAQVCAAGAFGACVCTAVDAGQPDAVAADAEPEDARADVGPGAEDAEVDGGPMDATPPDAGFPAWCESFPAGYVEISAGRFVMGSPDDEIGRTVSEGPQHTVILTRDYWMKATEVTQAEWLDLMSSNPSLHTGCPTCPVERVSWQEVTDYANALSRSCGLPACYPDDAAARFSQIVDLDCLGFRLPTEAEWEYAARSGASTAYPFGPATTALGREPLLNLYGWYFNNSMVSSQTVTRLEPSPWGLYDIHGNVLEWTTDGRRTYDTSTVTDPLTPPNEIGTVFRGGFFGSEPEECRPAARRWRLMGAAADEIGFRLVRTQP